MINFIKKIFRFGYKSHKIGFYGRIKVRLTDAKTGDIKQEFKVDNVIPTAGLTAIARRLINAATKSNEGIITYGAVGNGTGTPAIGDTAMENEIARKLIATTSNSGAELTIETFFATGEGNGSLTRFALFGEDASGAAGSGTMFEHAEFSETVTKTANDNLTVETTITLEDN